MPLKNLKRPILGFAACSGTGKTTLLKQLIPLLKQRNVRIGMIKHAHHSFDMDHPGKDSFELRKAGAEQMLIASKTRWSLVAETPEQDGDPQLETLLARLDQDPLDLILVEGFKHVAFPKLELHRVELPHPWLYPDDPSIIAVASNGPLPDKAALPQFGINEPGLIAEFIFQEILHRDT